VIPHAFFPNIFILPACFAFPAGVLCLLKWLFYAVSFFFYAAMFFLSLQKGLPAPSAHLHTIFTSFPHQVHLTAGIPMVFILYPPYIAIG